MADSLIDLAEFDGDLREKSVGVEVGHCSPLEIGIHCLAALELGAGLVERARHKRQPAADEVQPAQRAAERGQLWRGESALEVHSQALVFLAVQQHHPGVEGCVEAADREQLWLQGLL